MDEEYLQPNTDPKLNTIALPTGFDYKSLEILDDIDCHLMNCHELYNHPRYPINIADKKEYLSRLFHLLKSVPKTSLINDIFSSSSLQTVKLLSDQSNRHKVVNDTAINQPEYILFDEDRLKKRRRLITVSICHFTMVMHVRCSSCSLFWVGWSHQCSK